MQYNPTTTADSTSEFRYFIFFASCVLPILLYSATKIGLYVFLVISLYTLLTTTFIGILFLTQLKKFTHQQCELLKLIDKSVKNIPIEGEET